MYDGLAFENVNKIWEADMRGIYFYRAYAIVGWVRRRGRGRRGSHLEIVSTNLGIWDINFISGLFICTRRGWQDI